MGASGRAVPPVRRRERRNALAVARMSRPTWRPPPAPSRTLPRATGSPSTPEAPGTFPLPIATDRIAEELLADQDEHSIAAHGGEPTLELRRVIAAGQVRGTTQPG